MLEDVPPSDTNDHSLKGPGKWPEDLPGWKETIVGYMSALRVVSYRIVQLYALALGVEKDYFKKFYASEDDAMTLIRYSAEASRPSDGIYACGAHSDWGMTTVLATDGVKDCRFSDTLPTMKPALGKMSATFQALSW
eukprot:912756_1